jgi:hypothetical protein
MQSKSSDSECTNKTFVMAKLVSLGFPAALNDGANDAEITGIFFDPVGRN